MQPEAIRLDRAVERWWDRAILRFQADHVRLLSAADDPVLDSAVVERIPPHLNARSRHGRADPGASDRGTLIAHEHRHGYPGAMRQVLHDIEAGKLTDELRRRGISPNQRVRVVVEAVDDDEPPITALNAAGGAFEWLADEPDLYSDDDLVERYRP